MARDVDEQAENAETQEELTALPNGPDELIDLVIAAHEAREARTIETPARIDGVLIGHLVGLESEGFALVDWPGCPVTDGQKARVMTSLAENDVGRGVALLFEGGAPDKPVVMGLLFQGEHAAAPGIHVSPDESHVVMDGERVILAAEKEIVLQCGEASITLTRAGKIIIRGAYVSSRSTGVNRIQGGAVEIN